MKEVKKIAVIIPVYNRSSELRLVLDSLTKQTLPREEFQVIIADDGSAEDIQAVLSEYPLDITYRHQPDEGFRVSAARNLGADAATAEILLYNDNGIMLAEDNLQKHVDFHVQHGPATVVLGNMLGTDSYSKTTEEIRAVLDHMPLATAIQVLHTMEGAKDGREYFLDINGEAVYDWPIPWHPVWGGHFSVNRGFVTTHHIRWNEQFKSWGCEDIEYGIQLVDAGAQVHFARDIIAVHYPTPNRDYLPHTNQEEFVKILHFLCTLHPNNKGLEAWVNLRRGVFNQAEREAFYKGRGWAWE